jgi:uncharacterized protein YgbK (DUF1537 family)
VREWSIAADDRTGALEVGGELVQVFGPVSVRGWQHCSGWPEGSVIDLGTRHLSPATAGERAATVERAGGEWSAHKIDSTLRGNWAVELVARHRVAGRRVLVVPAWPALGRSCINGVVRAHGIPVADRAAAADALRPVASSRPADHLVTAGAPAVAELANAAELRVWLRAGGEYAVCDAAIDADVIALAGTWADHVARPLLAGPAGAIGAAARAVARAEPANAVAAPVPQIRHPVVVACGSLHPVARAQVGRLRDDMPDVVVLASAAVHTVVDDAAAVDAAHVLAAAVLETVAVLDAGTLVIIGGDTAAAVMGDGEWMVGGTMAPGLPWSRRADGTGPMVITKAGGFGSAATLVELLSNAVVER